MSGLAPRSLVVVLRLPSALAAGALVLVTALLTGGRLLDTDLVAFLIFAAAAILNNHVGVADDEQGQPAGICTQLRKVWPTIWPSVRESG
jgi:hypothetical protein